MEDTFIHVADDEEFARLGQMVSTDNGWKLEYQHEETTVWSKHSMKNDVKIVKAKAIFADIEMWLLFDVLMDGEYRSLWDTHMIESFTLVSINPNNDIGYYAMSCPPPIQNRDFVLQRSWQTTPKRISILNRSVTHKDLPAKKYFIRAIAHITGYVIEPLPDSVKGCSLYYVTATDPRGAVPVWAVNKATQYFTPRTMKTLYKACQGYSEWKREHLPGYKPWLYPEQIALPKLATENGESAEGEENKKIWNDKQDKLMLQVNS